MRRDSCSDWRRDLPPSLTSRGRCPYAADAYRCPRQQPGLVSSGARRALAVGQRHRKRNVDAASFVCHSFRLRFWVWLGLARARSKWNGHARRGVQPPPLYRFDCRLNGSKGQITCARVEKRLQRSSLSWWLIEKCIERWCLQGAGWELRQRSPPTAHSKRSTRARPGKGAPSLRPPHHRDALRLYQPAVVVLDHDKHKIR